MHFQLFHEDQNKVFPQRHRRVRDSRRALGRPQSNRGESPQSRTWLDYCRRNSRKLRSVAGTRLKTLMKGDIPLSKDMKQEARGHCCSEWNSKENQLVLNVSSRTKGCSCCRDLKIGQRVITPASRLSALMLPISFLFLDPTFSPNYSYIASCIIPSHILSPSSLKGKRTFGIIRLSCLLWMP